MLRCTMLVLLVGGIALSAAEEKAHVIKLKKPGKGDVTVVLVKHERTSRIVKPEVKNPEPKDLLLPGGIPPAPERIVEEPKTTPKGDAKPRVIREGGVFLFEETILEGEAGKRPTRLVRRYEQAVTRKDGHETILPFEWKTVTIEKKDDKYRYAGEDGKDLTGDSARTLDEEFAKAPSAWDDHELLLPKKPVRVNETWTIAVEPFVKDAEEHKLKVDAGKSTATGKLVKVYDKDGRRFGVLELHFELCLANAAEENAAPLIADITLDICIDGTSGDFLRTEKLRIGEAAKQPSSSEGTRQVMHKEIRKK